MKNEVISLCPVCGDHLLVTKLHCKHCDVEISGKFILPKINYLSKEQLTFVLVFLKNQGNIKAIEKEMDISYPTVKKLLNEVLDTLGFLVKAENEHTEGRLEILERLSKGEINFDEANSLLKKVN